MAGRSWKLPPAPTPALTPTQVPRGALPPVPGLREALPLPVLRPLLE
jgi:hypothetical protein